MEFEKIYAVSFLEFSDVLHRTVSDRPPDAELGARHTYIDLSNGPLLVRESELDYYRKFGGGYDSIKYVGKLPAPIQSTDERRTAK